MAKCSRDELFKRVISVKFACNFAISLYLLYLQVVRNKFLSIDWDLFHLVFFALCDWAIFAFLLTLSFVPDYFSFLYEKAFNPIEK